MDIMNIIKLFLHNMKIIVIFPVIFVTVVSYHNFTTKTPDYSATATLYVVDRDNTTASNIAYIEMLMYDYQQLSQTSDVRRMTQIALGEEYPNLGGTGVSVSMNIDNHVMFVKASGKNPATCANVANVYSTCMIQYLNEQLGATNISILEPATQPYGSTGPARQNPIMIAGVAGLAVGCLLIFALDAANTTIRTAEDVEREFNLPVLAEIGKFKKKGKK